MHTARMPAMVSMVIILFHLHLNQAGVSGREISDLDIYLGRILCAANELKDKPFTDTDMIHAADKVMQTGKCI